jgi:hypothetical protein
LELEGPSHVPDLLLGSRREPPLGEQLVEQLRQLTDQRRVPLDEGAHFGERGRGCLLGRGSDLLELLLFLVYVAQEALALLQELVGSPCCWMHGEARAWPLSTWCDLASAHPQWLRHFRRAAKRGVTHGPG